MVAAAVRPARRWPWAAGVEAEILRPADFWAELTRARLRGGPLALSDDERRLLHPGHPFRAHGQWVGVLATRRGQPVARAVASLDPRQADVDCLVGAVGFLRGSGDVAALQQVLVAAECWLSEHGASAFQCPVRFSSWFGHGLNLTEQRRGGHDDGRGLVADAQDLAALLHARGYRSLHHDVSHLVEHDRVLTSLEGWNRLAVRAGTRVRAVRPDCPREDLLAMYRVALVCFAGTGSRPPISFDEFAAYYAPRFHLRDPALVQLAEDMAGNVVGYAFAKREGKDETDGQAPLVVESVAVLPSFRQRVRGAGAALLYVLHERARECGEEVGIHARVPFGSAAERLARRWSRAHSVFGTFTSGPVSAG